MTAPRVRRLQILVENLPKRSPGYSSRHAIDVLLPKCGGPTDEFDSLIEVLVRSGLAQRQVDRLYLTRAGARIASMRDSRRRQELLLCLIRRGWFRGQIRLVLELGEMQADASLRCEIGPAREAAAQLVGVLHAWPGVVNDFHLDVPADLLAELDAPWSLIPVPVTRADRRKAIGDRGEAYSYEYLRRTGGEPDAVRWVALDDDSLGYDVEDGAGGSTDYVEVKASEQRDLKFYLSSNEYDVAHRLGPAYHVHFWAPINLSLDPTTEFDRLVAAGAPLVFRHLSERLADGDLEAEAETWVVRRADRGGD